MTTILPIEQGGTNEITNIYTKSTGLLWGGAITIHSGATGIDVAPGEGIIFDDYTDPTKPTYTKVTWGAKSNQIPSDIATSVSREVAIDINGNVVFSSLADFTPQEHRENIIIGWADSIDLTTITGVKTEPDFNGDLANQSRDGWASLNAFNAGGSGSNNYSASSNTLEIKKSLGYTFDKNTNYVNDPENPHITTNVAEDPCTIYYYYQSAPNVWVNDSPSVSVIDPDQYDTGTGLASVPTDNWTIQVISMYADPLYHDIQYGQRYYSSKEAAGIALFDDINLNPYNEPDIYRCFLIVKQGATDLSDSTQAEFINAGRGGLYAVGKLAKSRVANLGDLVNVSVPSPIAGQILGYNGLKYVMTNPAPVSAGKGILYYFQNGASGISTYETIDIVPDTASVQDESIVVNNETKDFEAYSTVDPLGRITLQAGIWTFNAYCYATPSDAITTLLFDVYKRVSGGTETLLFTTESADINNTTVALQTFNSTPQPAYTILATDILVIKIRAKTTHTSNVTVHFVHSGNTYVSNVETPLATLHNQLPGLDGGTAGEYYHLTQAEATVVGNTSGTNNGDDAVNSNYSGLATSKQDTLISTSNIKSINGASILGAGNLTVTGTVPDIALNLLTQISDKVITAGYCGYVSDYYEITDNYELEVGLGAIFEIG